MIHTILAEVRVRLLVLSLLAASPLFLYAQADPQSNRAFSSLGGVVNSFTGNVVTALGSLFIAAGTVAFFYGMAQYIFGRAQGNGEKAKVGNSFMVWGLIGVFVMVSVWGIVYWFQGIFGIQGQNNIVIPQIQIGGSATTRTDSVTAGALSPVGSPGATPAAGTPGALCSLPGGGYGMTDTTGACISSGRGTTASDPDAICRSYGPGTGCTVNGQAGACNASNVCVSQSALTP